MSETMSHSQEPLHDNEKNNKDCDLNFLYKTGA